MQEKVSKGLRKRITKLVPGESPGSLLNPLVRNLVHAHRARTILLSDSEKLSSADISALEIYWSSGLSKGLSMCSAIVTTIIAMTVDHFNFSSSLSTIPVELQLLLFAFTGITTYLAVRVVSNLYLMRVRLPRLRDKYSRNY